MRYYPKDETTLTCSSRKPLEDYLTILAESMGLEPTIRSSRNGSFQDFCLTIRLTLHMRDSSYLIDTRDTPYLYLS